MDDLPADLRALLEDPSVVVRQDQRVWELLAKWQRARGATEARDAHTLGIAAKYETEDGGVMRLDPGRLLLLYPAGTAPDAEPTPAQIAIAVCAVREECPTLYLNDEDPCAEDIEIVHKLRDCLRLYESRAARRTIEKLTMPEKADACPLCHHLLCAHRHSERLEHEIPR